MDIKATITKAELTTTKSGLFVVISGRSPHYGTLAEHPSNIVAGLSVSSADAGQAVLASLKNDDRDDLVGTAVLISGTILHEHSVPGRLALTARELKRMTGHELVAYRQAEHFAEAMVHIQDAAKANDAQKMMSLLLSYGASIGWSDQPAQPLPGFRNENVVQEVQAGPDNAAAAAEPEMANATVAPVAPTEVSPVQELQQDTADGVNLDLAVESAIEEAPGTPEVSEIAAPRPVPATRPAPITEEPPGPGDLVDIGDPLGLGSLGFDAGPTP